MKKLFLAAILFLGAAPCRATVTLNTISSPNSTSAASPTGFTVTSSTGNLLIVVIIADSSNTVSAVSGNVNGAYTLSATSASFAGGRAYAAYKISASAGDTTITVTHATTNTVIKFYDCSSSTGGLLDGITAYNTQSATVPAPAITSSAAGIVISAVSSSTNQTNTNAPFTFDDMNDSVMANFAQASHDVNGAGGLLTSTYTTSGNWCAIIVAFVEAPVSGGGGFGGKGGGGTAGVG